LIRSDIIHLLVLGLGNGRAGVRRREPISAIDPLQKMASPISRDKAMAAQSKPSAREDIMHFLHVNQIIFTY
jgi:hypothetical protein